MSSGHQFSLLGQRRFLPFFITQFLGAFNDNLFKITLVLLVTYSGIYSEGTINLLANVANGLFILPFFLFSATFGQLADKLEKTILIRAVKLLELAIMLLASVGFYYHNLTLLLSALFLMGTHSTLFGPVKYAILPQHLHRDELIGGNGLIEMGTFVAILLGQVIAGLMMNAGLLYWSCAAMIAVAALGYMSACKVPRSDAGAPDLKINWNFVTETMSLLRYTRTHRVVFLAILGISWFWFYGAIVLAQIPAYSRTVLHGSETVFTLLLAVFSIGIGLGSVLCEKMSQGRIEIGLVPFGSLGLSLFALDWSLMKVGYPPSVLTASAFLHVSYAPHIIIDLFGIGLFGGFYIVPLYTMIQTRTPREYQSRVIAANNVLNAMFMVIAAGMGAVLLASGLSIPKLILVVAIMNACVAIYIYRMVPEFLLRFVAWLLINTIYRLREYNMSHIPKDSACVLVCNHVSFVDAIIISAAVPRPVRFVMDHNIFKVPVLSALFRSVKAIPIASARDNPEMKARAFDAIAQALEQGEVICIFPEGKITSDGDINEFRPGIEDIIKRTPVPVIPMALRGLWGSYFSRKSGKAMSGIPWKFGMKIELMADHAWPADTVNAAALQQKVSELRGHHR